MSSPFVKSLIRFLRLSKGFDITDPLIVPRLRAVLEKYAEALTPWAEPTAARMLQRVNQKDALLWAGLSENMSRSLQLEIRQAPTGQVMRELQAQQVRFIKSLPLEAAQRCTI